MPNLKHNLRPQTTWFGWFWFYLGWHLVFCTITGSHKRHPDAKSPITGPLCDSYDAFCLCRSGTVLTPVTSSPTTQTNTGVINFQMTSLRLNWPNAMVRSSFALQWCFMQKHALLTDKNISISTSCRINRKYATATLRFELSQSVENTDLINIYFFLAHSTSTCLYR